MLLKYIYEMYRYCFACASVVHSMYDTKYGRNICFGIYYTLCLEYFDHLMSFNIKEITFSLSPCCFIYPIIISRHEQAGFEDLT